MVLGATLLATLPAAAATDHKELVAGPIASGPEATKKCLECHEAEAKAVMKTSHWTWSAKQTVAGRSVDRGKKNALNNYCGSITANEPRCTSCHIGFGWKDASFDFSDPTRVDCLVCHDTTGTYKKDAAGAGNPDAKVDLLQVAQSVGKPSRVNCGACHFFGGGGDAVKHGDLDSSMEFPDKKVDIHMTPDGPDFQCQSCHETRDHKISGQAMVVSPGGKDHIGCEKCHQAAPHKQSRLNAHVDVVACQTCHIPFFAKELPTKMSWDWSTAGQDVAVEPVDKLGKHTYDKKKGTFTWGKMVAPTYKWYNGSADAYEVGDKMDPSKVTELNRPLGSIKEKGAKIFPFKIHTGKQIYDKKLGIFIPAKVFGPGGYWKEFDWEKAAQLGMEARGMKFSGEYGFAPTIMYWRINHMVAPKEQALGCLECHGDNGRMDWKGLGYQGDPMSNPQWAKTR
jgi:octaheme c-type cytochrome (tetrathionate reductase family)